MAHKIDTESYKYDWMDAMLCGKLTREMVLTEKEIKKYRKEFVLRHIKLEKN